MTSIPAAAAERWPFRCNPAGTKIIWYGHEPGIPGLRVLLKQTTPVALSKITGPYAMGLIV